LDPEAAVKDLIENVSSKTGLSREMSRKAADAIATYLERELPLPIRWTRLKNVQNSTSTAQAVRQLNARLLSMQDDERRRIAREMHDGAGQTLAALAMNLRKLQESMEPNSKQAQLVSDTHLLLQDVTKELRTISHLLHPPLLDEVGLPVALQSYVYGFAKRSGIDTTLELTPNFGRLPFELEITIFRVVQECLINVHRHSGSATAEVRLTRSERHVRLEVQDQGKGIAVETRLGLLTFGPMGVGLRGIRERVSQIGGVLEIRSDAFGTVVTAVLPTKQVLAATVGQKAA
jgi:signal transduction histidine kinase